VLSESCGKVSGSPTFSSAGTICPNSPGKTERCDPFLCHSSGSPCSLLPFTNERVHRLPLYCSLSVLAFLFRLYYMPVRDWSTQLCSDRKVPQIQKAFFSSSMFSQMTDMLWYPGVCLGTDRFRITAEQHNSCVRIRFLYSAIHLVT